MAAGALAGLMGPQLKEFEGDRYDWSYSCCGMGCTGSAELEKLDGGGLGWCEPSASSGFAPLPACCRTKRMISELKGPKDR